jgi:hypothetical protein
MIIDYNQREALITTYLEYYNRFDIEGMLSPLSADMTFENVSNGQSTLTLQGIEAFRDQAQKAAGVFSERSQKILSFQHTEQKTEVEIAYDAILAVDLSENMKRGDRLQLKGRSIYQFTADKISVITDIS